MSEMSFEERFERLRARYEDGERRFDAEQLVRMGNVAYGAGLCLLMLERQDEGYDWLDRAAARWFESWDHATPTSWGRPVGVLKAKLIARRHKELGALADWTLALGAATAESPIGRYAACLAQLALGEWSGAALLSATLTGHDEFPQDVAAALAAIAAGDEVAYGAAAGSVLASFEARTSYLEDVPVADTVLVLQELAAMRELSAPLPASPVLPS
jgi:hypothetical protein